MHSHARGGYLYSTKSHPVPLEKTCRHAAEADHFGKWDFHNGLQIDTGWEISQIIWVRGQKRTHSFGD